MHTQNYMPDCPVGCVWCHCVYWAGSCWGSELCMHYNVHYSYIKDSIYLLLFTVNELCVCRVMTARARSAHLVLRVLDLRKINEMTRNMMTSELRFCTAQTEIMWPFYMQYEGYVNFHRPVFVMIFPPNIFHYVHTAALLLLL